MFDRADIVRDVRLSDLSGVDGQNLLLGGMVFTVARLGFVATFKIERDDVWSPWL